MIEATTKWSVTRRKVFTNCARRYAIKYIAWGENVPNEIRYGGNGVLHDILYGGKGV